jgi:hypothetical protein
MRYYIAAFSADARQVLGNLDGQAALGDVRRPMRCRAWRIIASGRRLPHWRPDVTSWRLVDADGRIVAAYPAYPAYPLKGGS